jgi:hypothetical protein
MSLQIDLGKCDVCDTNKAIGTACTSIPFSCSYCTECAQRGADPEWIFNYWKEDIGAPENIREPDLKVTFKNGKYMTYREWYNVVA